MNWNFVLYAGTFIASGLGIWLFLKFRDRWVQDKRDAEIESEALKEANEALNKDQKERATIKETFDDLRENYPDDWDDPSYMDRMRQAAPSKDTTRH